MQSIRYAVAYGNFPALISDQNVSFGKGVLFIRDEISGRLLGYVPSNLLDAPRSLFGFGVLVVVVAALMALGRRVPPVMVGIVLLASASLFPPLVYRYYLVFALPIAALVLRDPDGPPGSGIFDRLGDRRRAVGVCVSFATALSIAYVALAIPYDVPIAGQTGDLRGGHSAYVVDTTVSLTPLLWLIACVAIIVSYNHRPAPDAWTAASTTAGSGEGETKHPPASQSATAASANAMSPTCTSVESDARVERHELGD